MAIEKIIRKKGFVYRSVIRRHRIKLSKCFRRMVDAEQWERDQLTARGRDCCPQPLIKSNPMTLNELRTRFEREYGQLREAPSTLKLEMGIYEKHVASHLGAANASNVTPQDIEDLIAVLSRNSVSPGRINRVRILLHGLFAWGTRRRLVQSNPVSEIEPLPTDSRPLEKTYNFLTQREAAKLLDWLSTHERWLYPKARILLNTGLRFGEMSALRVQDVSTTPNGAILRVSRTFCRHTLQVRNRTKGKTHNSEFESRRDYRRAVNVSPPAGIHRVR